MPNNPVNSRQADRWRIEMNEVTMHWLVNTLGGNISLVPRVLSYSAPVQERTLGTRLGNHLGEKNPCNPQYSEKGHHIEKMTSRASPSVIPIFQDVKDGGFHEYLRVSRSRSDSVSNN